ncbi:MAG: hypothetical protein INQ03_02510 [Candidatus Heimdallarchaeota archaeon]|nr:hypothetical protein [Candidatus Heimdallarchaeota archaeon]
MEISYERGIMVTHDGVRIMLDPEYSKTPIGIHTIVTHAHSDHVQVMSGESKTHLTQATLDLFSVANKRRAKSAIVQEFHEPFEIGPFEIELINAGHLLGAAQIIVRQGNHSFAYQGDSCPEDLLTVKGADIPRDIDILSIDATYGDPNLKFQPREVSRKNTFTWTISQLSQSKIPVLYVAKMGGAQEIIKYLNNLIPKVPILVESSIALINDVYNKHLQGLNYDLLTPENIKKNDKFIMMIPRSKKKLEEYLPPNLLDKAVRCMITGQTARYNFSRYDFTIPLSTHASYSEIVDTINKVKPLHVLTNFGYHEELAQNITSSHEILCDATATKFMDSIEIPRIKQENFPLKESVFESWFDID